MKKLLNYIIHIKSKKYVMYIIISILFIIYYLFYLLRCFIIIDNLLSLNKHIGKFFLSYKILHIINKHVLFFIYNIAFIFYSI